jgi:adenylate cyclase
MAVANKDQPEDRRIVLRVGVNLGDVMVEGGDLYGEGVNIAARIQQLAAPGGILIAGSTYDQVKNKIRVEFDDLGEHKLKNINEPIRIYHVAGTPHVGTAPADKMALRPTIAVLPFSNVSGDPDQEYFADGISEDIMTALAAWRWFPVIGRNSAFTYKGGKAKDVMQVGRDLGARYLVEGSVRKAGGNVRISAQLIECSSGHHLWAKRYDRELSDIFALQDQITADIVASIEPQLNQAEQARALRKMPDRLDTWDLSLKALWHIHRANRKDYAEAEALLERALRLDPTSSYTHSILALCQFGVALLGWTKDPPNALAATHRAAQEAVILDEGDWLAHALLGISLLWTRRDFDRAIAEEQRALALNPSATFSHQFLGCVLVFNGQPREAIPHLAMVLQLDPRYQSTSTILADLALSHFLLGEYELGASFSERAVAEQANNVRAWQRLAAVRGQLGQAGPARAALDQVQSLQPDFSLAYVDATYPFRTPHHRKLFVQGLRRAGLPE